MTRWLAIPDALAHWSRERPDEIAQRQSGLTLTYRSWWSGANATASVLAATFPSGSFVAIPASYPDWRRFVVAYVGVQLAGCIPVPLKADLTSTEWATIRAECPLAAVVTDRPGTVDARVATLDPDTLAAGRAPRATRPVLDRADVVFTSGTTGRPKGVVSTHAELLAGSRLPPTWRGRALLHSMPPSAAAGVQGAMLLALMSGVEARTVERITVVDLTELARETSNPKVAGLYVMPAVATSLVKSGLLVGAALSHVKMVMITGAATPTDVLAELAKLFERASIVNLYGATEAGTAQTLMTYQPRRPGAVGRAMGRTQIRIVLGNGARAGVGAVGEVWLRRSGAGQRRYVGASEASALVFLADGWVRTGDLGYLDDDGYLYIVDRSKDVINRGGEALSSGEIEDVLLSHDRVVDAAVVGEPTSTGDEAIVAVVVAKPGVTALQLRSFVRERLNPSKVPTRVLLVAALPRNTMGKVDKAALRQRL